MAHLRLISALRVHEPPTARSTASTNSHRSSLPRSSAPQSEDHIPSQNVATDTLTFKNTKPSSIAKTCMLVGGFAALVFVVPIALASYRLQSIKWTLVVNLAGCSGLHAAVRLQQLIMPFCTYKLSADQNANVPLFADKGRTPQRMRTLLALPRKVHRDAKF